MLLLIRIAFGFLPAIPVVTGGQTVDDFAPMPDSSVIGFAVQPDQKVLIGGVIFSADGRDTQKIARYVPGGTPDLSYVAEE